MGLINIFKFRNWAVNFELKYCYGTLRIWRSGPKVLNTEISVFGRLSVKVQLSFYSNSVFYSYSEYIVKDETYLLDMFATS